MREVVRGEANVIKADLAKFSWKCSLALVLIMVAAETFHFIHPAPKLAKPVLGIQANGWNSDFFGGPLKVGIWEGEWAAAHSDQPPYDTEVKNSQPVTYMIQGSSPMMTIHLEQALEKMSKQAAVASETNRALLKKSNPEGINAEHRDAGPASPP
jgi:hypothetical protein